MKKLGCSHTRPGCQTRTLKVGHIASICVATTHANLNMKNCVISELDSLKFSNDIVCHSKIIINSEVMANNYN